MLTRYISGRIYNYEYCVGRNAFAGAGFAQPADFAIGSGRSIYVINKGNEFNAGHGLTKCTIDSEFIWEDRGPGFAGGNSPWPSSVAVDSGENVYVSDDYTSHIDVYDKEGNYTGQWGEKGTAPGQLNGPSGLDFDADDNLYVVDGLNNRVQVFSKDGAFRSGWGSQGSGPGRVPDALGHRSGLPGAGLRGRLEERPCAEVHRRRRVRGQHRTGLRRRARGAEPSQRAWPSTRTGTSTWWTGGTTG